MNRQDLNSTKFMVMICVGTVPPKIIGGTIERGHSTVPLFFLGGYGTHTNHDHKFDGVLILTIHFILMGYRLLVE